VTQPKQPEVGPAGRDLIANVGRLLVERGLSQRKLSAELERIGRPISPLGVSRLLKAERRVDVDELLALAEVLQVPPEVLLMAPEDANAALDEIPAPLREARNLAARIEQLLEAHGDRDLAARQVSRAFRMVEIRVEELLEEAGHQGGGRQ
jgi:transcriptional regulator with XRE-family HTH domain